MTEELMSWILSFVYGLVGGVIGAYLTYWIFLNLEEVDRMTEKDFWFLMYICDYGWDDAAWLYEGSPEKGWRDDYDAQGGE